ncbi:FCD domain-containing protein [Leifsonia shinshuensis]|uniref:FCD domain-containing protein n=1 Tax=Leifsonia shinshuensis TaxID=150026 RepID=UPI00285CC163|nr:FCD domain-containing protein [Leifsonia shinshuensis]MDR6972841.1 DNA-binding FadR family transcriptional regulator [Leifsonia shinshuensis]
MTLSGNHLATNITRILFEHARQTVRFSANQAAEAHELTLSEHRRVYDAIEAGDAAAAQSAMKAHIIDSWRRRRLPTRRGAHPAAP